MLTLKNIRKRYGLQRVLEAVSFSVGEGQKVALVGLNGSGKSTLLKIIAGIETPDRGEVLKPNRVLLGYLPQEALAESDETLLGYLRRMTGLTDIEQRMRVLESQLERQDLLAQYEVLQEEYVRLGGYDFMRAARNILNGLQLSSIALDRLVAELSGGEKRKVALAGVLLRGVDVLLLDEPTNNLDVPALLWLERYLKRSKATCVIASHDRCFLDAVVEKVFEIDWYKREVIPYTGGWSAFAEMKAHKIRQQKEQYRAQEEERSRLLISMDQKMDWVERIALKKAPDHDTLASHYKKERATKKFTSSAKALEGRQKRLSGIEKPLTRAPLLMTFPLSPSEIAKAVIELKNVCFGYQKTSKRKEEKATSFIAGPVDMQISFGSRVAILGNNGVGKSTLLKTIAGTLAPLSGERICGEQLRFGYVMQEYEHIARVLTVADLFRQRLDMYDQEVVATHLARFQFAPDVIRDKISALSPGERARLLFAVMSVSGINVLLLDEPTNHLDLETIEALEEALEGYGGTIILVTHDRRFLERVRLTDRFVLENGILSPIESFAAYVQKITARIR